MFFGIAGGGGGGKQSVLSIASNCLLRNMMNKNEEKSLTDEIEEGYATADAGSFALVRNIRLGRILRFVFYGRW